MDLNNYVCFDASNVRLVNYIYTDRNIYGYKDSYPKPKVVPIGGDNSISIFEKNGIPLNFQKVFFNYNTISKGLNIIKDSIITLNEYPTFKAKGYLSNIPVKLKINKFGEISGEMIGEKSQFDVYRGFFCNKEYVEMFFIDLREQGLLNNYIKAINEILQLNLISEIDEKEKVKSL